MFPLQDVEVVIGSWFINDLGNARDRGPTADQLMTKLQQFIGMMSWWQKGALLYNIDYEHYSCWPRWAEEGARLVKYAQDCGILCVNVHKHATNLRSHFFSSSHYRHDEAVMKSQEEVIRMTVKLLTRCCFPWTWLQSARETDI